VDHGLIAPIGIEIEMIKHDLPVHDPK